MGEIGKYGSLGCEGAYRP